MDKQAAARLIKETFEQPFDKPRFADLILNLFKSYEPKTINGHGILIPEAFQDYVQSFERLGKYLDSSQREIDILIVKLKKDRSLDLARSTQRNFIARYLNGGRGGVLRDAAVAAFVSADSDDWRFSLVKMEYQLEEGLQGKVKVKNVLTPARRWSFRVGKDESSHTAQSRILGLLVDDKPPVLPDLEEAFNVEVVTREFFDKYAGLYEDVKKAMDNLVTRDEAVRREFERIKLNAEDFSKKLLGQIVFLYFLQKKGWFGVARDKKWGSGPRNYLRLLFEKNGVQYHNFFNDVLESLFYEALASDRSDNDYFYGHLGCRIPFLNGGLFDPINGYGWVRTDILLPNELFSNKAITKEGDTGNGILDVFDRYNFTVKEDEPLEKEVAVDPEMLGKVFENLEVEDRKGKGTYYTPRSIVEYMCQESLINYLDTALNTGEVSMVTEKPTNLKLFGAPAFQQRALKVPGETRRAPREDIEAFIRMGEMAVEHDLTAMQNLDRIEQGIQKTTKYQLRLRSIQENAALIDQALEDVRVCDPAVGSGAFLVGLMTEIVRARNTLTSYLADRTGRTNYNFKRHAIQNCLYGVDIDPGAVEIAKLRLWLSLIVDEEEFENIRPLPNLDYRVVCANSLLRFEQDFLHWPLFDELQKLKEAYFDETSRNSKEQLKAKISAVLAQIEESNSGFNFTVHFSEIFPKKDDASRGFDIVIANPPYVRQEKIKEQKADLKKVFPDCYEGAADIYVYFYRRGCQLLKKGGALTFISSNKYFRAGYGEKLRGFLATHSRICRIIDFGDAPVFEAIAYPSIILLKNAPPDANKVRVFNWAPGPPLDEFAHIVNSKSAELAQKELTSDGWRLEPPAVLRLLEKLRKAGKPLGEYVNGRFYRGITTGLNEAFVVDRATRDRLIAEHPSSAEVLKPFLRGRDVKRWRADPQDLWLIFTRHGVDIKKYPAILRYLSQYKKQLTPGVKGGRKPGSYEWYEIQDNIAYWQEFGQPKIILGRFMNSPTFAFDRGGFIHNDALYMIAGADEYVVAILNSAVCWWFLSQTCTDLQNGYLQAFKENLFAIPIPEATSDPKARISEHVSHIIEAKSRDIRADVSKLELAIDQLVYELYGLTPEEIAVVEGKGRAH